MNKLKKLLGCGLVASMLLSMAACDEAAPSQTGDEIGDVTSATTTANTVNSDKYVETDKEAKDLNTGEFTPSGNAGVVNYLGIYDITIDQKGREQCLIFESEKYGGDIVYTPGGAKTDDYFEKLSSLISSDNSPDLVTFEYPAFPYGVNKKMYEPLDDYLNADDPIWASVKPFIDMYEYKGQHYYFPHRIVTRYSLNYNRKTIEAAGLKDPYDLYVNGEWTWDTWKQMMIEFCNKDPENNIGLYCTDTMLECFLNTTGTSVIEVSPSGVITNNMGHPNITRAIDFLSTCGKEGLLYPYEDKPYGDWVAPDAWAPVSDKLLFLSMEPEWTYNSASEKTQDLKGVEDDIFDTPSDFGFVPFPRDPNADEYYMCGNTFGYMIPRGAKNIDGAVEFIMCNRLYETDQAIIDQAKKDHIAPAVEKFEKGKYKDMRKWVVTWSETYYDLWMDMCDASEDSNFTLVLDGMYGFDSASVTVPLTKAIHACTFGPDSWAQTLESLKPEIDAQLAEYN